MIESNKRYFVRWVWFLDCQTPLVHYHRTTLVEERKVEKEGGLEYLQHTRPLLVA